MGHVLVISSDPAVADACHEACHTCTVVGEHEAVSAFFRELPDLVLLASANPRPFARGMRAGAPVVAICDDLSLYDQVELRKAGVSAFVFQPYSVQTLRKLLADQLGAAPAAPAFAATAP
jgi:DNA-binding response OmpR family regulator